MSLRDYIQNNYWWKLLSLLLATLTWFTIWTELQRNKTTQQASGSAGNTRAFPSVPVAIKTAPSDTRGFKVTPARVLVKVIGKEEKLDTLLPDEIEVLVDLTASQSANRLRKDVQVRVPDGVFVVRVVPDIVDVEPIATAETAAPP
jgi:YbbR domain-containing protein